VPLVVPVLSATLVGKRVQVRPVAGEALAARPMLPVNPWTPVTVMAEVPVAPARMVSLVRLAATVKSWTVKVTTAVRVKPPLEPLTVTV